ncbi:hypothetical protein RO3G_00496 [Rhizopus delemar RA 99-880]|uniref:SPX domain-containing protein n=3 Tax=Rhizopus TaxID=4842 RepID=I1BHW2_RHIO9|nr:hypothetical protein RO3G_00496 [Rhizopus delemar RA 99-880]|eukprot:EIE75792.1 hypothetical protein RO3G_00496 [Rhizopus delemar RA 99-880]
MYFTRHKIDSEFERISQFIETKMKQPKGLHEARLLLDFIHLNTFGFKKILKKHDKWTEFTLEHRFAGWDRHIAELHQILCLKYHETSYWIHPDNLKELESILLFHLPKEEVQNVQSVYFDSLNDFQLYSDVLKKKKGAELIRMTTWHKAENPLSIVLFEQKEFEEFETISATNKSFYLKPHLADKYLRGEWTPNDILDDLQLYLDQNSLKTTVSVASTISKSIQQTQPILRCHYQSTLYSANPNHILTLKTNLSFSKEINRHPTSQGDQHLFPYAILKLKSAKNEQIPDWLSHLTDHSRLIYKVPYFEEYLHGMSCFFQDRLPLLPWWLNELNKDIRKGSLASLYLDEKEQQDYLDDDIKENLLSSSLTVTDQEPRRISKQGYLFTSNIVTRIKNMKSFGEDAPPPVYGPDDMNIFKWLYAKFTNDKEFLSPVLPNQDPRIMSKKTARLEPKLFMANERIFMSWLQFCALLLTLSLGLINFGDQTSRISGALFIMISITVSAYSLLRYQYRAWQIRFRSNIRFDDIYGPAGLCFIFVLAAVINLGLRMDHPVEGLVNPFGKTLNETRFNLTEHNTTFTPLSSVDDKALNKHVSKHNTTKVNKYGKTKEDEDEDED